jgi:hypothetical protein
VENKLTPAERAARYRERKKAETDEAIAELASQVKDLKRALRQATKLPIKSDARKKGKL